VLEEEIETHISQLQTRWSLVRQAHGEDPAAARDALTMLVHRYQTAVYRYLLCLVRQSDVADELFQEFALKLARGDLRNASSERGQFRKYLKTVLFSLVRNHHSKKLQQQRLQERIGVNADTDLADSDPSDDFDNAWRSALLSRTWAALRDRDQRTGQHFFEVLHLRAENPELKSSQMAEQLNQAGKFEPPLSAENTRKLLQRAREMYADLLLEEVGASLETDDLERLEEEIAALNLYNYCRPALDRRRAAQS